VVDSYTLLAVAFQLHSVLCWSCMFKLLSIVLLLVMLLGSSTMFAEIGNEQQIGTLRVRTVVTIDELTVFLATSSCDTTDARVTARIANEGGGWKSVSRHVQFIGCSDRPVQVTLPTGHGIVALYITELQARAVHSVVATK
jgi:hypothetical protein